MSRKIILTFVLLLPICGFPQSIVESLNSSNYSVITGEAELVTERILKISPSKRIFLLSNNNESFGRGDFISLLLDKELIVRALVASIENQVAGIKITKIYSVEKWPLLKRGVQVQVIRGDDSFFKLNEENPEENQIIKEEEDLFNDTILEEDEDLEEKTDRIIRPDNMAAFQYGQIDSIDTTLEATTRSHFLGAWAYQVADNIWAEFSYGQGIVSSFPSTNVSTTIKSIILRLKYTIKGPWYSYFLPYAGYISVTAESDLSGSNFIDLNNNGTKDEDETLTEQDLLDAAAREEVIFGVTILKRFVPGWFIRADIGSDIISGGLSIEF